MKNITSLAMVLAIFVLLTCFAYLPASKPISHISPPLFDLQKFEQARAPTPPKVASMVQRKLGDEGAAVLGELGELGPLFWFVVILTSLCTSVAWATWKSLNVLGDSAVLFLAGAAILIGGICQHIYTIGRTLWRLGAARFE